MEQYKKEFIQFMVESKVLKFGDFTLKSGRKSPFFMNAGAYVTGEQLSRLGEFYAHAIHSNYGDDFELIKIQIKKMFNVGKTYSRKEVKEKLQAFYNSVGLKRTAKHTDLMEVMTVREKIIKGERLIEIIKK